VRVDVADGVTHVGGGAVWADVDHETQVHGLATTGGLVSSTGVGGFTLGGGLGWLMRKHGLAADNLVGADVVTADGQVVRASESENPELLWGLRGGGGNFGVVTQLDLKVHPVGPTVYAGPVFYPGDRAAELLRLFRDWAPGAPDEISALVSLTSAPPLPVIPAEWHGRKVAVLLSCSVDARERAESVVKPFREPGSPIADLLGPMPYAAIQTLLDPLWPHGLQSYFKATNLSRLDDGLIDGLVARHLSAPGPQTEIHVQLMGGAVGRVADDATAFPERSMPFVLNVVTGWRDPSRRDAHVAWARDVVAAAGEASTGRAYANFQGEPIPPEVAYGAEKYGRLVALKREYDPTNVFKLNQNIQP